MKLSKSMQKKASFIILGIVLVAVAASTIVSAETPLSSGAKGEEVKNIQEILKTDPTIYPEGLVTGYYGSLTKKAVEKLQARCGIPATGDIDSVTKKCIFPVEYSIRVVYPNGGEVLDKNQIHTIRWEVIEPAVIPKPKMQPFWPKASIDLFKRVGSIPPCRPSSSGIEVCPLGKPKEESIFVRHLATVNLFDQAYSLKIPNDVPNGSDYLIRISIGENIVPIVFLEKTPTKKIESEEVWPEPVPSPLVAPIIWDESDNPFTISGEVTPKPTPDLSEAIKALEKISQELAKVIELLKKMMGY